MSTPAPKPRAKCSKAVTTIPAAALDPHRPPDHLKAPGAAFWRAMLADHALDSQGQRRLLLVAAEAVDLADQCRRRIARDGLVTASGRQHPLMGALRDAQNRQLAALKALNLEFGSD